MLESRRSSTMHGYECFVFYLSIMKKGRKLTHKLIIRDS